MTTSPLEAAREAVLESGSCAKWRVTGGYCGNGKKLNGQSYRNPKDFCDRCIRMANALDNLIAVARASGGLDELTAGVKPLTAASLAPTSFGSPLDDDPHASGGEHEHCFDLPGNQCVCGSYASPQDVVNAVRASGDEGRPEASVPAEWLHKAHDEIDRRDRVITELLDAATPSPDAGVERELIEALHRIRNECLVERSQRDDAPLGIVYKLEHIAEAALAAYASTTAEGEA